LRFSGPHQALQLPNELLFKPVLIFPMTKPYMLFVKLFHH
jgi:hypothetical protein